MAIPSAYYAVTSAARYASTASTHPRRSSGPGVMSHVLPCEDTSTGMTGSIYAFMISTAMAGRLPRSCIMERTSISGWSGTDMPPSTRDTANSRRSTRQKQTRENKSWVSGRRRDYSSHPGCGGTGSFNDFRGRSQIDSGPGTICGSRALSAKNSPAVRAPTKKLQGANCDLCATGWHNETRELVMAAQVSICCKIFLATRF
jgi:hypothetical protein